MFFLDPDEKALIDAALAALDGRRADWAEDLREELASLGRLAEVLRESPPIARMEHVARVVDGGDALLALLERLPDADAQLHLPTKAVVGQAYLLAKIHLLENIVHALGTVDAEAPLVERATGEWAQSLHSWMAEELLLAIAMDPAVVLAARRRAGELLFTIWEDRLLAEVDDFAPLLESAWRARQAVQPVLGTLLGSHEIFALFREADDDRMLAYFIDDDVPPEHLQAFEEFLFGLAHEDLERLRARMKAEGQRAISTEEARAMLGESPGHHAPGTLRAFHRNYSVRRLKAQVRALTGAPGPRKTAEEYALAQVLADPEWTPRRARA